VAQCRHPALAQWMDPESGETVCRKCAQVLPSPKLNVAEVEKFGRGPTNAIVFNKNLGSTSKSKQSQKTEPRHLHVLTQIYGTRDGKKPAVNLVTKSCPSCHAESHIRLFGDSVHCEECGAELGYYTLRWVPNGHGGSAASFWADLRLLEAWDGPDDDPVLKVGRELLRKKLLGHVKDEEAHFLARKCLAGLKELSKVTKREVERLIDSVLEGEKVLA
jgi:hypothetical protein